MSRMSEFPAILNRELHARVIDVSASGCLVETRRPLEVGTIGRLRVSLSGEECEDDVEVMRGPSRGAGNIGNDPRDVAGTTFGFTPDN